MLVTPSEFVLKYAPWSPSKSSTAEQCPYRFYRQYVKKDKAPSNADALVGQTVHKILEYVMCGMAIHKALELSLTEYSLTTQEVDRVYGLKPQVQNFSKKFAAYKAKHNGARPLLEQKLGVTLDSKPVKFFAKENLFFRGVIDLSMIFTGRPHVLILDHKTGKQHSLTYYKKQFDAYKWLLKAKMPTLEGAQIAVNFAAEDCVDFVKKLQPIDDVVKLRNTVITNLNEETKNSSNFNTVRKGPLCNWCGYKYMGCPAHVDG